ncbi:MAG: Ribosomal RNA small subunit methyltransferase D [Chlamydiales bacterium]|nr:Ribosomal RNA small subunit methyltransferase D [Chlamydiales bacterium]MCH9619733.1 Ribosomal RNA small subunit methyltransferase D [Chlamydiales bacterium]MCH9623339.1 Ribosomal RNA small subunit methyltransferase D [Chlamydiales bacterium]
MIRIIGGKFKGHSIEVPKKGTRPTLAALRESLFNICQHTIEGATFLDLFSGGGAIGLEALSRGAAHVTFVEKDGRIVKKNCSKLGVADKTTCLSTDVFKALPSFQTPFDIIFADPPYGVGLGEKLLDYFDENPYLIGGDLFIEESIPLPPPKNLILKSKRKVSRSILLQLCNRSCSS